MMQHLIITAKAHDLGLAAISLQLAVAWLSYVPLPYQLWRVVIFVMDGINDVTKLAAWADTSRRA